MKSLGLSNESSRVVQGIFKQVDDKNVVLKKKVDDLKRTMKEMMKDFSENMMLEYSELERVHKETLANQLHE